MLHVVILAAGEGKRMHSSLPKVLHPLAGRPLLEWVMQATQALKDPQQCYIVIGHGAERVKSQLSYIPATWVEQSERWGTGHAVAQVLPLLPESKDTVLVLFGDVPLITASSLQMLLKKSQESDLTLATTMLDDPTGFGRIVRDAQGRVVEIVEEKDANVEQRKIKEIYTGILLTSVANLKVWLPTLERNNAQGEYYLTDVVKRAVTDRLTVTGLLVPAEEVQGINDRVQLAKLERSLQRKHVEQLMLSGVTVLDPARIDIRGDISIAPDVTLDINVVMEGKVRIGKGSYIGPNVVLRDVAIGEHCKIYANSVIEGAVIADYCNVGPFARIRPETELKDNVRIGNFVEVKKSNIGAHSKVNHLSYIGDAVIGENVNIGAGTITCNYDGIQKHQTVIGDNAFIGSDTQLVAPVTIGAGATIGAGSTITRNAPPDALTLSRSQQETIKGWRRRSKRKQES